MDYFKEREQITLAQLEELKTLLPPFCGRFFLGISGTTTPLTRLNYARDLKIFFNFLVTEIAEFHGRDYKTLAASDLDKIDVFAIEFFLDWLGHRTANTDRTKMRKLACLRSFFAYYFKIGEIQKNILPNVDMPKMREKTITRLENAEVHNIFDAANDGVDGMSARQARLHDKTRVRDITILMFFLGIGIRVSELVGLNKNDIDMENKSFRVTRKGGKQEILFMPPELEAQLQEYLETIDPGQTPLFMSLKDRRIGVRTVQLLVKKYARVAAPLKNISPHKLRSTFGTRLYRETGDIYVVADVLGHKDINTTKKHYAAISEDIRKAAATQTRVLDPKDKASH